MPYQSNPDGGLPIPLPREIPEALRKVISQPRFTFPYLREGDLIFFADYALGLKWHLDAVAESGRLVDVPRFQQMAGDKMKNAGNFLYLRYDPILKVLYNTVMPIAQIWPGASLRKHTGIDLAQLPTADFLEKYFGGIVLSLTANPNWVEITAVTPLNDIFLPKSRSSN